MHTNAKNHDFFQANTEIHPHPQTLQFIAVLDNRMGELIPEETVQKIVDYCRLDEEEAEIIRKYIKHAKPYKKVIRDVLSEEGAETRQAFLLLEGQVNIAASLTNAERAVLSQVGREQLLNLEIALTDWQNKYSLTVASSQARYITFGEREIRILTHHIANDLQQKAARREKEVARRNKQIREESRKKRLEESINKLILPEIQPKSKRSLVNPRASELPSIGDLPLFSKELKKQGRSSSLSQLKSTSSRYSQPATIAARNMQEMNQRVLEQFHDHRDRIAQTKLERLKSERSVSLNEKELKEYDYSRNEKLFKEHLKHIVKRKLMFERKHFKILTNFKNDRREHGEHGDPPKLDSASSKYEESPENPIDNYFLL